MLTQFVFMVFAILGVLSLIVDVGLLRITRGQMQHAADAAAIEGLRKRDVTIPVGANQVNDPFAADCIRRASANRLVRWTFDDDVDLTNGDAYQYGAGPIINVSEGVGNLHGLGALSVPETPVYKPDLQMNQRNEVQGDMVSGRFCYTEDPSPSESANYDEAIVCTQPQNATGAYARNDFNPSATSPTGPAALPFCPEPDDPVPAPWPAGGVGNLATANDTAFLVRLRRSNELAGFANQTDPDVASSGPSLPLLFGRGTTIQGDQPGAEYSVRRDGFTVRASAIADARPALQVGLPQTNPVQLGVTPFALSDTFVGALPIAGRQATINPVNGLICAGLNCNGVVAGNSAGRFIDNLLDPTRARWRVVSRVGAALLPPLPVNCAIANTFNGYGPVYSTMASGAVRVIGFTRITLSRDPVRLNNLCAVVVTRAAVSRVAPSNASAVASTGLPLPANVGPAEVTQLIDKNRARNGNVNYIPVLAPVLAR